MSTVRPIEERGEHEAALSALGLHAPRCAALRLATMNPAIAGRAAAPVVELWDRLAAPSPNPGRFEPSLAAALPEAARRFLTHSIAPGTPLARAVLLEMEGQLRVGRWLPFRATQVLAPPTGFVWAARAGWGPVSFRGFDRYADGGGEMQWRLAGIVPLIQGRGPHVARSAAGRLAAEAVLAPTTLLSPAVTWQPGVEGDTAVATWRIGPHADAVTVYVNAAGQATKVTMMRWGNPGREPFAEYPFAALFDEPATFDGVTIGTRVTAGWFYGTPRWEEGIFFRARITAAELR